MYKLRFTLLLLFFSYASGELANKPDDIKTPTTTSVTGTPNAKDNASTTAKSKTEKRDSANQTGTPAVHRIQDEPFRPIYAPGQYQQEASASASAPAAAVNAAFQPTTVRYMAAEAVPQAYYEKAQAAAGLGGRGGIHYASSAYRGPFNPSYQSLPQSQPQPEQQQQLQQQQHQLPREQQQQQQPRQQQHLYAYAEPDAHYTHERETPQPQQQYQQQQLHHQQQQYQQQLHQYAQQQLYAYYALQKQQQQQQQQRSPSTPSPSPSPPPPALQRPPHTHAPQQQVHYVIAIPLSYMRQLQQQLVSAHEAPLGYGQPTPTALAQPHARLLARPQSLVLLQPIAREQLAYQPPPPLQQPLLQYSTADAAPPADTPAAYNTQLIQLPANLLFAAGRLPPAGYHMHRSPVFQPFFYGQPQHVRQQQLQQQQSEPYAQQQPQSAPYQHSQQQQKQKHQQQKQPQVVRIGGTKSTAKLIATPSPSLAPPVASTAATAPHMTPQAAAALSPIVHYNPAYVQAPPPAAEQPAGAILNYAPFVQGQYGGMPQATLVKLSAPSALVAPSPHHYYTLPHHPLAAPKLSAHPMAAASAAAPASYIVRANHYEPGAALRLPFFQQAGGVHYGTHLYHPPTPTMPSKATANGPQQQQQQSAAAGGTADDSANIVKYP